MTDAIGPRVRAAHRQHVAAVTPELAEAGSDAITDPDPDPRHRSPQGWVYALNRDLVTRYQAWRQANGNP